MAKRYKTYERYGIVWGLTKRQVSSTEKFVLLALNEHADADGGNCFPSTSTLAEETGFTRQAVSRAIAKLSSKGIVSISKRFQNGAQKSNNYTLNYGVMLTANPVNEDDTPCNRRLHPPVNEDDTPCNRRLHPPVIVDCTDQTPSYQIHLPDEEIKEGDARENSSLSIADFSPLPQLPIKTDKYFGQQKQTQLERHQAIANQHAVKESEFESVEEQDNFFAYLTETLAKESNVTPDKARVFANAACRRLLANQSDPNDRQHLKEFRSGLERVSSDDGLLAKVEAIKQTMFRRSTL